MLHRISPPGAPLRLPLRHGIRRGSVRDGAPPPHPGGCSVRHLHPHVTPLACSFHVYSPSTKRPRDVIRARKSDPPPCPPWTAQPFAVARDPARSAGS